MERAEGIKSLFINLTHHPTRGWPPEQLAAAQEYGNIRELMFPFVAPKATKEDVLLLARSLRHSIAEISAGYSQTYVLMMGELSLCAALWHQERVCHFLVSTNQRRYGIREFVGFREIL